MNQYWFGVGIGIVELSNKVRPIQRTLMMRYWGITIHIKIREGDI